MELLPEPEKKSKILSLIAIILLSSFFGFLAGGVVSVYFFSEIKNSGLSTIFPFQKEATTIVSDETQVIEAIKKNSPSVVSIVISKEMPVFEEYYLNPFPEFFEFEIPQYKQKGTQKQEIGGGTGFIISEDGLILTNKHVVSDKDTDYTIITNENKRYKAKVLAKDPIQDLAILKIEETQEKFLPVVLGDSSKLQIGQSIIAIGNALGEFRNTVSAGVISGLGRTITASGGGIVETIEDVIQTDAAINKGNSGGPLLNLNGEVIGVNVAMVSGAQNIGFAIPINKAKRAIEQIKKQNKIVYPFLGIRYILITEQVKEERNLKVDYGALIIKGKGNESAIFPGSAAEKAGLKEGDIVLEFDNRKITATDSLAKIISEYYPSDKVSLKVLRGDEEMIFEVVLGERESE